ncbi:MAG: MobF family relaxase [Acidimicrobiales bacterium]|jgi:conjugative relaxase-like TrwC/TraI family protein
MLSIGKMVAGSEQYYLDTVAKGKEEYYTGSGEAPGQWLGSGSRDLGLVGEVAPDHLRSVLSGVAPDGRSLMAGRARPEGRVSGFDFTFSAPKSVSLLYGLGDPTVTDVVRRVHAEAVADALGYLERNALRVRRGAGGERRIGAEGLVAASFQHRTSRAGDPQLHTHVLVANATLGEDGTWSAPDARLLYFHSRTAGFLYQAALRAGLSDALGVRFGPVDKGMAELDGISDVLLKTFSTRRSEIERHMARNGTTSARGAEVAALITRGPKQLELDHGLEGPTDLRGRWRARADDLGIPDRGMDGLLCSHLPEHVDQLDLDALVDELTGPAGLCASDSTFERRDVVRAVAGRLVDGGSVAEVERVADHVLASSEVVPLASVGRGGELRHTTLELLTIETALLQGAVSRAGDGSGLVSAHDVDAVLRGFPLLDDDQRAMVTRLTTSGAGVDIVVGRAGSGKTTALAASEQAWRRAGYSVTGTALSARAALGLEEEAGIPSTTLHRLLADLDKGITALGPRHIVVLDEAGMVGTRQLGRLLEEVSAVGAKVVLVGDPRQLPEIEAGGAVAGLIERLGAVELTGNHRQGAKWERVALDELRHGNPIWGLAAFEMADRVHTAPSMAEARAQLVQAWLEARGAGDDSVMLAANRTGVTALNQLARAELRRSGELGPDRVEIGGVGLTIGDRVICLRNDSVLAVLNGILGAIRSISDEAITITTDQGLRRLPFGYVMDGHLDHGYATTIHKSQGLTVDRAFVLATDSLTREAGYVAMSRARKGTDLYVPISAFEDGITPDQGEETDPMHGVEKRFLVSRAKDMASDDLAEPFGADRIPSVDARVDSDPDATDQALSPIDRHPAAGRPSVDQAGDRDLFPIIGRRPTFLAERADYDRVARAITSYRTRYGIEAERVRDGVTVKSALGYPPLEVFQRSDYERVLTQVRTYQRRLGLDLELDGPHRGMSR